ncbi:diguanylate cyclase [Cohnella yongneupensis]|uniref:Diguanylate cyclase n=1 Tax=Cohnella yongneupensis TaxID=425006 RepID=A0ABW0QZW3_9BACL
MDALFHASALDQLVFESMLEPAVIINKEGIITSINRTGLDSPIYDLQELGKHLNQSYLEFYKDQEDLLIGITHVLQAKETTYSQKVIHDDYSFLIRIISLKRQPSEEILGALIVYIDTTEQRRLEEIFTTGAKQFRLIAEHSKDMIKVTDTEGNVEYASPSHEAVLGYIDQSNVFDYVHPEDVIRLKRLISETLESGESSQLELRKKGKSGDWIWVETVCSPVVSDDGSVRDIVLISRDITERKQLQFELEQMAYFDFLTGLYNRRKMRMAMEETLEQSSNNGEHFAILIMDLDKFKWINDTYGHDTGDLVLKEFAHRLLGCKSEKDIAGRLGGDEFTVILKTINGSEDIHHFIRRFQLVLREPYTIPYKEESVQIKSSVGYSIYPHHGDSVKSLLKHADNLLYREKRKPIKALTARLLRKSK